MAHFLYLFALIESKSNEDVEQQSHCCSLDIKINWITVDDFPVTWFVNVVDCFPKTSTKFDDCSGATKTKLFLAEGKEFKDEAVKEKEERCLVQPWSNRRMVDQNDEWRRQ